MHQHACRHSLPPSLPPSLSSRPSTYHVKQIGPIVHADHDLVEHAPMLLQPRVRDPQVGEGARLPPGLAGCRVCGWGARASSNALGRRRWALHVCRWAANAAAAAAAVAVAVGGSSLFGRAGHDGAWWWWRWVPCGRPRVLRSAPYGGGDGVCFLRLALFCCRGRLALACVFVSSGGRRGRGGRERGGHERVN